MRSEESERVLFVFTLDKQDDEDSKGKQKNEEEDEGEGNIIQFPHSREFKQKKIQGYLLSGTAFGNFFLFCFVSFGSIELVFTVPAEQERESEGTKFQCQVDVFMFTLQGPNPVPVPLPSLVP